MIRRRTASRPEESFVKKLPIVLMITLSVFLVACQKMEIVAKPDARLVIAQEMVQAWNDRNWDRVYELFAEDGVLHSVMNDPIVGRENIRARLTPMTEGIEQIELRIVNMGLVGDVVMLERVDDFVYNGKHGQVPVVGVMEISDGKVRAWREYYDHDSLVEAMSPEPRPEAEIRGESEAEIRATIEKLQADWNGGDMDAYLDAYWNSDDLSLMFGSTAVRGWQAVHDLFTSSWMTEEAMGDFEVLGMEIRFSGPDTAIASGGFEHQFPDEKIVGAFTHVLRRVDDSGWKIVHEHTSRGAVE